MDYVPPRVQESFFVFPSSPSKIKYLIISLANKEFTANSIPVFIYKKVVDYLAPVFSVLFNKSVSEGIFPNILKIARVTPIYKSKSHKIALNFRPISLLSFTSNILKKLIKK